MGGLFGGNDTVIQPVQSNESQIMMQEAAFEQNTLLMQQMQESQFMNEEAAAAQAEQLREIELRDAAAEAEKTERKRRMAKGKRDLLYGTALGVEEDEEDETGGLLLLGGE